MKEITKSGTAGTQKVVYDQVDSTFVAGVHVNPESNFSGTGIIPAGTPIKKDGALGVYKVESSNYANSAIIGLTQEDLLIDDIVLANIVTAGTCRTAALPTAVGAAVADLKTVLPRITFY